MLDHNTKFDPNTTIRPDPNGERTHALDRRVTRLVKSIDELTARIKLLEQAIRTPAELPVPDLGPQSPFIGPPSPFPTNEMEEPTNE